MKKDLEDTHTNLYRVEGAIAMVLNAVSAGIEKNATLSGPVLFGIEDALKQSLSIITQSLSVIDKTMTEAPNKPYYPGFSPKEEEPSKKKRGRPKNKS